MLNTEMQPPKNLWIDKMPVELAIQTMLNNQEEAIYALQKAMPQIKIVIETVYKKLINNNIPIIEYIRSYSSKIDKARVKIMKEFKFKNQELYKMNLPFDRLKLLYDNIYKEMCKILLK